VPTSALVAAIARLAAELRPVEVLEYSPLPAPEFMKRVLETTVDDVWGPLEFSVLGVLSSLDRRARLVLRQAPAFA